MSESALAVVEAEIVNEQAPSALMRRASDVAEVCREIVTKTAMNLQGKKYVKYEGWCSIAAAYGCVPSVTQIIVEDDGVRAISELRRHDGTVIATAEGFVGMDEPRWANQPMYARRGMASTRAVSRVCRQAFSFVLVMIDESLEFTPAEEIPMPDAGTTTVSSTRAPARAAAAPVSAGDRTNATKVRFGKSKGKHLCDIDDDDLSWQLAAARKSAAANDPKWDAQNKAWLASVETEAARRNSQQ